MHSHERLLVLLLKCGNERKQGKKIATKSIVNFKMFSGLLVFKIDHFDCNNK